MTLEDYTAKARQALAATGLEVRYESITGDGSCLMRIGETTDRCLDVWPNGDMIVILMKGEKTHNFGQVRVLKLMRLLSTP